MVPKRPKKENSLINELVAHTTTIIPRTTTSTQLFLVDSQKAHTHTEILYANAEEDKQNPRIGCLISCIIERMKNSACG